MGALIGLGIWKANAERPGLKLDDELIPNQLLTTYPVIFLSGRKSVFYFLNYWNNLPERLYEHGHVVSELHLPWRDTKTSISILHQYLEDLDRSHKKVHIFADPTRLAELEFLASSSLNSIQSLNLVCKNKDEGISSNQLTPLPRPVHRYSYNSQSQAPSYLSLLLVKCHKAVNSLHNFDAEILGFTSQRKKLEAFYLEILTELAVKDLRS